MKSRMFTKTYYNCTCCCCTHARATPTDVPVAVCTYLLYLLLYLLYAHVLYLLLCSTYYVLCTADVRPYIYIHIEKKRHCCRVDVLHVPTDAHTYIEEKKVPAALSTHLLHILLFLVTYVRTHRTYLKLLL